MKVLPLLPFTVAAASVVSWAQEAETSLEAGLLEVHKSPGSLRIDLHDPRNRAWALQTSPNLVHWTPVRSLHIANTDWSTLLPVPPGQPSLFVRAVEQPGSPPLSTAHSLDLGEFDYEILESVPSELSGRHRSSSTAIERPEIFDLRNQGATLGRVLFHDKRLSRNHNVSCASCHQQQHAFSDPRRVSIGTDGTRGARNAPSLVNTNFAFHGAFFWDRRAATLEEAVLLPIQDPNEMNLTLVEACDRVAAESYYQELFTIRFGDTDVTPDRVAVALSQFLRSIVSKQSKFDARRSRNGPALTEQEDRGWWLFRQNCYLCHPDGAFQREESWNIGLDAVPLDLGVGALTGNPEDAGVFKIPTLRNVALTAPYMHDGRFETLEQVIDHYSEGINHGAHTVVDRFIRVAEGGLQLTDQEKSDLLAFLHTLTDHAVTTDPRFSDPFRYGDIDKNVGGGP